MKKIAFILILALLSLIGCSHGAEIKQRLIVEGIYIDSLENGQFNVVVEILDSSIDSTGKRNFESEMGNDIDEILLSLENKTASELFYKNLSVIVVDLSAKHSDVLQIVNKLIENQDIGKGANLVFCEFEDGYLDSKIKEEIMISNEINSFIENMSHEGLAVKSSLITVEIEAENKGFFKSNIIKLEDGAAFDGICYLNDIKLINLSANEALFHSIITAKTNEFEIMIDDVKYDIFNLLSDRKSSLNDDSLTIFLSITGFARSAFETDNLNSFLVLQIQNVFDKLYDEDIDFLNLNSSFNFHKVDFDENSIIINSDISVNETQK